MAPLHGASPVNRWTTTRSCTATRARPPCTPSSRRTWPQRTCTCETSRRSRRPPPPAATTLTRSPRATPSDTRLATTARTSTASPLAPSAWRAWRRLGSAQHYSGGVELTRAHPRLTEITPRLGRITSAEASEGASRCRCPCLRGWRWCCTTRARRMQSGAQSTSSSRGGTAMRPRCSRVCPSPFTASRSRARASCCTPRPRCGCARRQRPSGCAPPRRARCGCGQSGRSSRRGCRRRRRRARAAPTCLATSSRASPTLSTAMRRRPSRPSRVPQGRSGPSRRPARRGRAALCG
mmetsp:Transcript_24494/g.81399  ORF Transcript_24494/g.81399 Transcript_24494/m.81399 type:complete len:294 (-) Transcript_24494:350-1231(-)